MCCIERCTATDHNLNQISQNGFVGPGMAQPTGTSHGPGCKLQKELTVLFWQRELRSSLTVADCIACGGNLLVGSSQIDLERLQIVQPYRAQHPTGDRQ